MSSGTLAAKIVNVSARAGVKGYDGSLVSERMIEVKVSMTLDDASVVTDYFMFTIDKDTGEYRSTGSMLSRVVSFSMDIDVLIQ